MFRLFPTVLGGLVFMAALAVSGGASLAATPEDALMPVEQHTTPKGRSLASVHRPRLLQLSEQIYNCMPWLWVYPGGLGFRPPRDAASDDRYLSAWIYVDQREDPVFAALPQERRVSAMFSRYGVDMLRRLAALPDVISDADVAGLSVVVTWLKPSSGKLGRRAVNETLALFIDKATAVDFLAKRVSAEEFTNRAQFTLFDGQDTVGRVPMEVWEDSFNSTYRASNYEPPKGVRCP